MKENPKKMNDEDMDHTPMEGVIGKLKSYVKNPKLATSETLQEVVDELEEMKPYMDGEEEEEDHPKKGGLMILIGKGGRK